jgi:hypothetical protein
MSRKLVLVDDLALTLWVLARYYQKIKAVMGPVASA